MVCHLVDVENNLGRSTVIDLNAKTPSKFRQVDHRSIEFIIFENVKYVLRKGAGKTNDSMSTDADSEDKKEEPKWNSKELEVGNWFSGTRYFRAVEDKGDSVICRSSGKTI